MMIYLKKSKFDKYKKYKIYLQKLKCQIYNIKYNKKDEDLQSLLV